VITVYFYLVALERWVPLTIEGSGVPLNLPTRSVARLVAEGAVELGEAPAAVIYRCGEQYAFFGSEKCQAPELEHELGFVRGR
jgi:hypothetical protein